MLLFNRRARFNDILLKAIQRIWGLLPRECLRPFLAMDESVNIFCLPYKRF